MGARPTVDPVRVGDVIDLQTLGADVDDYFIGVTVTKLDDDALTVQAQHPRPIGELGEDPFWIPWRAVAWLRQGTSPSTFTDPADDPEMPDEKGNED